MERDDNTKEGQWKLMSKGILKIVHVCERMGSTKKSNKTQIEWSHEPYRHNMYVCMHTVMCNLALSFELKQSIWQQLIDGLVGLDDAILLLLQLSEARGGQPLCACVHAQGLQHTERVPHFSNMALGTEAHRPLVKTWVMRSMWCVQAVNDPCILFCKCARNMAFTKLLSKCTCRCQEASRGCLQASCLTALCILCMWYSSMVLLSAQRCTGVKRGIISKCCL